MTDPAVPPKLRVLIPEGQVRARIDALVAELARDFAARRPLLVLIAEGALRFGHELASGLELLGVTPDVVVVRARRTQGTELRQVEVEDFDAEAFGGRHVLIVDDIADEGRTMTAVVRLVESGAPRSLALAVLVSKPSRRLEKLVLDYVGFEVPDAWIVGFGMDLDDDYRDLDHLALVEAE